MLKKIGETAMRQGLKLMASPSVMKLMSDPRVMKVMMQAFQLRGTIQGAVEKGAQELAHRFGLVTEDEVIALRSKLRDLEAKVETVEAKVDTGGFEPEREVPIA
jgi:hypothetical protein